MQFGASRQKIRYIARRRAEKKKAARPTRMQRVKEERRERSIKKNRFPSSRRRLRKHRTCGIFSLVFFSTFSDSLLYRHNSQVMQTCITCESYTRGKNIFSTSVELYFCRHAHGYCEEENRDVPKYTSISYMYSRACECVRVYINAVLLSQSLIHEREMSPGRNV